MLTITLRYARQLAVPVLLAGTLAACGGGGSGGGGDSSASLTPPASNGDTGLNNPAPTTPDADKGAPQDGSSVTSPEPVTPPLTDPAAPPAGAPAPGPATDPVADSGGPATAECDAAKAEWIWCDDFERDRTASYFEASMPRESGVGRDGSYAAVGRYVLGSSEAGNLKLAFGRTPSGSLRAVDGGTKDYREIYWRVYVKQPADWQGGGADKLSRATVFSGSSWQQAMIAHVWSSRDSNDEYLKIDPATGTTSSGKVTTTKYNDFDNLTWLGARRGVTPLFDAEHKGEWQCIEARVQLNDAGQSNGVFQLWVNDKLDASRTDLNWVGSFDSYGINGVFLENYWNAGTPVEQERYMDNFVVSTARIGC